MNEGILLPANKMSFFCVAFNITISMISILANYFGGVIIHFGCRRWRAPTASPSGERLFRNIAVLFEDAYHQSSANV